MKPFKVGDKVVLNKGKHVGTLKKVDRLGYWTIRWAPGYPDTKWHSSFFMHKADHPLYKVRERKRRSVIHLEICI